MNTLAQRIKERREKLGLTQEELAHITGYTSRSSINKIELGKTDLTATKIEIMAKALQTTPAYLLGLEEKKEDSDVRDRLHKQPGMRILFNAAEGVDDETLIKAADLLKSMKKASRPEESD